jgi:hypothetical protein
MWEFFYEIYLQASEEEFTWGFRLEAHTNDNFASCLKIRRPGFNSRHFQNKKKVVGLERGPLSPVSTIEELLERKVAAPV